MSDTSAQGAHGSPLTINDWPNKGDVLQLRMPTWGGVIAEFSNYLMMRDRKTKVDSWEDLVKRGMMTRAEMFERVDKFDEEAINGLTYSFGGPRMMAVFEAMSKLDGATDFPGLDLGLLKLISLVLGVDDVIPLLAQRRAEAIDAFKLMLKRALPPKDQGAAPAAT